MLCSSQITAADNRIDVDIASLNCCAYKLLFVIWKQDRQGVFCSRMKSYIGRKVQLLCHRYNISKQDFFMHSPRLNEIVKMYCQQNNDLQPVVQTPLIYELVMVRDD